MMISDPSNPKERMIKGCQVFVPETVFFKEDGKIDFLTTTDRDCCVSYDIKTKLENLHIRTKLAEVVKDRKKDTEMHGRQKAVQERKIKNSNRSAIDHKGFKSQGKFLKPLPI